MTSIISDEDEKILNFIDACQYLGISRMTMYRLVKNQKIAYSKIGIGRGRYRFRKEDLDAYLKRNRVEARPE